MARNGIKWRELARNDVKLRLHNSFYCIPLVILISKDVDGVKLKTISHNNYKIDHLVLSFSS